MRASLNNNNNSSQHEPRRSHSSLRHKDSIEKQPDIEPRNDVRDSSENPYQLQSRGFEAQELLVVGQFQTENLVMKTCSFCFLVKVE